MVERTSDEVDAILTYKYKWKRRIDNFIYPIQTKLDHLAVEKAELEAIVKKGKRIKGKIEEDEKVLGREYWKLRGR